MDREVCGVCGAWKGDDELIALRQDLAAARALLAEVRRYAPGPQITSEEMSLQQRIDAALAGEGKT